MRSIISNTILFLLITLFVYAAVSKLADRQHFAAVLSKMPIIKSKARALSFLVPIDELLAALLLFFPKTRVYGLWISLMLMVLFTGYITYLMLFAPHLPCSCGGVLQNMSWKEHLVFNTFFLLLPGIGIKLHHRNKDIVATHRPHVQRLQGNR